MKWAFNTRGRADSVGAMHIDTSKLARYTGRCVPADVADLVEIAEAVQFVDRMTRRPPRLSSGDPWSRDHCLLVGVRQPDRWQQCSVVEQLHDLLMWLTDDEWSIEFTQRSGEVGLSERQQFLFENEFEYSGSSVALYSGGLDSFAGLAADIEDGASEPILVSIVTNHRQGASQSRTVDALREQSGADLSQITVHAWLSLREGKRAVESTHRTRGFAFLAVAAAAASMVGTKAIRVYENGVGAINLPYSRSQVGAHATRSMHPATLARAERLFSTVLEHRIEIVNPNQYLTKSEMCRRLPAALRPAIRLALSCDTAYAHRASRTPNCGSCTSCLLRRQALHGAGLGYFDAQTAYRTDVLNLAMPVNGKTDNAKSMLAQAARIDAALRSNNPWRSLVDEFPDVLDAVDALTHNNAQTTKVQMELMDMYRRYVSEWLSVPVPIASTYLTMPEHTIR